MFENMTNFFKKLSKKQNKDSSSKNQAKERLHLVLMQDRANVSADFLDLMRQEIIDVIKKYIEVDESAIDVRLTNKENEDGTNGAPALYANIPIINIKENVKKEHDVFDDEVKKHQEQDGKSESKEDDKKSIEQKDNKVEIKAGETKTEAKVNAQKTEEVNNKDKQKTDNSKPKKNENKKQQESDKKNSKKDKENK